MVVKSGSADLRKGASFPPIAVGILAAMSRVNAETLAGTMFAGSCRLDGTLKPVVQGVLPVLQCARGKRIAAAELPAANAAKAAGRGRGVGDRGGSLKEVIGLLNGEQEMTPAVPADGSRSGRSRAVMKRILPM